MAVTPRAETTASKTPARARDCAFVGAMSSSGVSLSGVSLSAVLLRGALLSGALAAASAFAQTPVATERTVAPQKSASNTPPASAQALPAPPPIELRAGEYLWMPELAPKGPVVIVVSLPEQLAYVYRNGVRIAISTVSTGKPGYETPTGVFTILQKSREHYSNLYDNAPMPFMQRLTWDGVALHAGKVPNYPASHGCVRLPYAFSEKLFGITQHGMTVVIADDTSHASTVAYPGLFAPVDTKTGATPTAALETTTTPYRWTPEASPNGPITLVLSTHDRELAVLRNGVEIGRAPVRFATEPPRGTQAYVLLEGSGEGASPVLPDRPALRWMALSARTPKPAAKAAAASTSAAPPGTTPTPAPDTLAAAARGDIAVAPEFARAVYDALTPGTTLIVTDEALHARDDDDGMTVLRAEQAPSAPSVAPPIAPPSTEPRPGD